MKLPYLISKLPFLLRIGLFFDFKTGQTLYFFVYLRLFTIIILLSLNVFGWEENSTSDRKLANLHDGMVFLIFLTHEFVFIKNISKLSLLIKFILSPLPVYISSSQFNKAITEYKRRVGVCGMFVALGFASCVVFYSIAPSLVFLMTSPGSQCHQPYYTSPAQWLHHSVRTNAFTTLIYTVWMMVSASEIALFFAWNSVFLLTVLRVQLKIRFLIAKLATIDETVERAFQNVFWSGTSCRDCQRCEAMTDYVMAAASYHISPRNVSIAEPRDCCKLIFTDMILSRSVKDMVKTHLEIMRLVRMVNKCFNLSLLSYNQLAAFTVVIVIPKFGPVNLLATEYLQRGIEVFGTFLLIGVFYYCGQIVLNESDKLRRAIHNCSWVGKSQAFQRSILLMMTMGSKPLRVTAGGMYTVGMESFTKIVRAIYSYVSLLQSVKGSKAY